MTKEELQKQYNIPDDLSEKYAKKYGIQSFRDADIANISLMMTLYEAGFRDEEIEQYLCLCRSEKNCAEQQMRMLLQKREEALSVLHKKQKQLDGIDYLRYKLQCERNNKK